MRLNLAAFAVLAASSGLAAPTLAQTAGLDDDLEPAGWKPVGGKLGGGFETEAGGLTPAAGEQFFHFHDDNGYRAAGLTSNSPVTLEAGAWELRVAVGHSDAASLIGGNGLAAGPFDPSAESAKKNPARALSERIEAFANLPGVTRTVQAEASPAAGGWDERVEVFEITDECPLVGQPVKVGLFALAPAGGGAVAFDDVSFQPAGGGGGSGSPATPDPEAPEAPDAPDAPEAPAPPEPDASTP